MKIVLNNKTYDVTLPDREAIKAIKYRVRLYEAENNPFPDPDPKKNTDYQAGLDDIHYWIASEMCGIDDPDPVVLEAIGKEVKFYVIQGPPRSRIPTMEEIQRMVGCLALGEGDKVEKASEIWELIERIKQVISAQPQEQELAEADKKKSHTPSLT